MDKVLRGEGGEREERRNNGGAEQVLNYDQWGLAA